MRVLIIGATGFTGSALIDYLSGRDDLDVTAVVHNTSASNIRKNIRYIKSSLHKLPALLAEQEPFDFIFHLARISGKRWGNIGRLLAGLSGSVANKRLLRTLKFYHSKARIVYLSGSLMYGHNPGKVSMETDKLHPAGFGRYYYHAERPLLNAIHNKDSNIIMLRAPWILGKGSWFTQLYEQHIRKHKTVPVYGDEERRMSLVTVEDCARMLWHYALNAPLTGVYNICTFNNLLYGDFIECISKAYKTEEVIHYDESTLLKMMDKTTVASICCEVLQGTNHNKLLNSYQPLFTNINIYLTQLAKKHD